jgi:hypothetical protein
VLKRRTLADRFLHPHSITTFRLLTVSLEAHFIPLSYLYVMKTSITFLALLALGASAAPANTTHEYESRAMRAKRGASFNTANEVTPMAET